MYQGLKQLAILAATAYSCHINAIDVEQLRINGPFCITAPLMTDTLDAERNKIDIDQAMMKTAISPALWEKGTISNDGVLNSNASQCLHIAGFNLQTTGFAKCKINITCKSRNTLYVDGNESGADVSLVPGRHSIAIKLLQKAGETDTIKVKVESDQERYIVINPEGKRYWTNADMMTGERLGRTSISSSGKYVYTTRNITKKDGQTASRSEIIELATGNRLPIANFQRWAEKEDKYVRTRANADMTTTYELVDVKTGQATTIATIDSKYSAQLLADMKHFLISEEVKGPEEKNRDVHQILEPDDRQPGWRNRWNYALLDAETGFVRQLTKGPKNAYCTPSRHGDKILIIVREDDLTQRPFSFSDVLLYDLQANSVDTLIRHDGFLHSVQFSPDEKSMLIIASPEGLGGIGNTLPKGVIPSSYEYELYIMDLASKEIKCLTRDFNPSISSAQWSELDGNIYTLTENRDKKTIFQINPKSGKITELQLTEPYIYGNFDLATEKPYLIYTGESSMNTERTWLVDLKTGKERLINDLNPIRLDNIQLGECKDWNFVAERGDTIYGCYYLPPYFDETKQYPMLVYYYGGCSPVGRYLDSYYNYQEWAAMGYVVYVLQPSGCSGFGQEFAARHVNAYGDYTADDIIQGTKQFCKEHPYVNPKKIGCMGASYGGFMTQYLQTKTDIFAAAMSHAGISNPASYWGFGYWGYSYNTVAAADSYPWNNQELYSGHAPLFNADKVHTPILFMHGGADTNVPINESIQMFTALKILGRETAFITVDGENHHILDFNKRIRWHDSIMAWFARWLQDDPTWWENMYPTKNLK